MNLSRIKLFSVGTLVVIILTIVNQGIIQYSLLEQKDDATAINLAGRQRMLSQKLINQAYQARYGEGSLSSLKETTQKWTQVHKALQNGDPKMGILPLKNKEIQYLFDRIEPYHQAMAEAVMALENVDQLETVLPLLQAQGEMFLPLMDTIVQAFELQSIDDLQTLTYLELFLDLISLGILIGLLHFFFRPKFTELNNERNQLTKKIDELKETQKELLSSTERFDLAVEATNSGVWDWIVTDGTEWWSKRFYEMLGYESFQIEATYDTFLNKLVHPEDRDRVKKAVTDHLQHHVPYKLNIRMQTKSGEYRWFESVGQARWDEKGNPLRMVGSIIDIDERIRLTETTQKVYAIIAHDLRGAFGGITSVLELLQLEIEAAQDPEEVQSIVDLAQMSTKNASELLENLLQWIRMKDAQAGKDFEPLDLNEELKRTLDLLHPAIHHKKINISLNVTEGITYPIGRNAIGIIFRNLLNNAIKFSHQGGDISISLLEKDDMLHFKVRDNGMGMRKELAEKLFQVGHVQESLKNMYDKGNGLGLILCNEMVQKANGQISVSSEENVGTEFSVTFPLLEK